MTRGNRSTVDAQRRHCRQGSRTVSFGPVGDAEAVDVVTLRRQLHPPQRPPDEAWRETTVSAERGRPATSACRAAPSERSDPWASPVTPPAEIWAALFGGDMPIRAGQFSPEQHVQTRGQGEENPGGLRRCTSVPFHALAWRASAAGRQATTFSSESALLSNWRGRCGRQRLR